MPITVASGAHPAPILAEHRETYASFQGRIAPLCGTTVERLFDTLFLIIGHTIAMQPSDEPTDEPHEAYGLPAIFSYSYCSRAAPGVGMEEVERIITTARHHNPRLGITGMLVFGEGVFFQWIEGPRHSIAGLVERLAADPRHDTIIALDESEEVRERLFPEWDMELVSATDIREVLVDAIEDAHEASKVAGLQRLLSMLDSGELRV